MANDKTAKRELVRRDAGVGKFLVLKPGTIVRAFDYHTTPGRVTFDALVNGEWVRVGQASKCPVEVW